jgi:predicted ATP-grasp superfamily ATP-dependent carboligase
VEEDADHTENTRYILAVMLERRKILVETDTQRTPTGILRIYENRKSGEIYIVKDPNISLSQVDALQQEVVEFLESQSRPTEPPDHP